MDRRFFLKAGLASSSLAFTPAAFAGSPIEAQAVRVSPKAMTLTLDAGHAPLSVFVSSDPAGTPAVMREIRKSVTGTAVELPLPVSPRPYLLLRATDGMQYRVAERLLPLQGGRNFRDLGGYRVPDGRQVRWGQLYRSGVMNGLTSADMEYLTAIGLTVICDLRSIGERAEQPNPFLKTETTAVIGTDYEMPALSDMQNAKTRDEAIAAFAAGYISFTEFLTPQYTDMFARLVRHQTPLAFNCSAGKDRTGVGAALILSVLGVPRASIVADYALTQVYTPPSLYMNQIAKTGKTPGLTPEQAEAFSRMPKDVLQVLMGSDPAVMEMALAEMDRKYGGPVELAKARFGLTDEKVAQLRKMYLI
ncbi:MAG TPA: tyrosine-protein phosphatase [Rhizomicrobium sp.]|jgi:protein-tyrosine phosphatase